MSGSFWVGSAWRIGSDRTASRCGGPDWTRIRLTKMEVYRGRETEAPYRACLVGEVMV
jgi:hypothetical protein